MKRLITVALLVVCSGCASVVDGSTQEVMVATTPDQAYCKLIRQGTPVGEINKTPGTVTLKKTKHDLTIECQKEGFHKSVYYNKSDIQGSVFGNIILGGGIGWAIDSASGSDNRYTSPVNISLVPLSKPAPKPIYSRDEEKKPAPKTEPAEEEKVWN